MHYTHHFAIIRKRRHVFPISLVVLGIILSLIFVFGFSKISAYDFLTGFGLSFVRVLAAYLISLALALAITIVVTKNKRIEDLSLPILDVLQSFPCFSILPLIMAYLGDSNSVTIIILVITMIWPILFSLLTGFKAQNPELLEASKIFGATGYKKIIYVTIPLLYPALITGSIVAWGEAWEAIIATEIITKIPGVGTYLDQAAAANNSNILIIGILLLLSILFIFNKLIWIPLLNKVTKYTN
jgi:NitT/TauT family transport system permease protein